MKTLKSILSIMIAIAFITFTAAAQQQQPNAQKQQAPAKQTTNTQAKQASPKDEWTKNYNEWDTKVNKYKNKVKESGDKYPDFSNEVKTLDQMVSVYNQKIARWDQANANEKTTYNDMMKADGQKIKDQEAKVKTMYDKNWPAAPKKETQPKQK